MSQLDQLASVLQQGQTGHVTPDIATKLASFKFQMSPLDQLANVLQQGQTGYTTPDIATH